MTAAGELILIVEIAGRLAAVRAVEVASVSEIERIVPVPGAPDYIEGLGAQRSRALTIINTRRAIGIADDASDDGSIQTVDRDERCLVIARDEYFYALRPDRVIDVGPALSECQPPPRGLGKRWTRATRGLVETAHGPALLLDIDAVLQGPDKQTHSSKAAA